MELNVQFKKVDIATIKAGDTILHNGEIATVCNNNIKYDSFIGYSLFGDSYKLNTKKVILVKFIQGNMDFKSFKIWEIEKMNQLPLFYAFSNETFNKIKKEKNISNKDIFNMGNGTFMEKKDAPLYESIMNEIDKIEWELKKDDAFLYEMFYYTFNNMEYCITYNDNEIMQECGYVNTDFKKGTMLYKKYFLARKNYLADMDAE